MLYHKIKVILKSVDPIKIDNNMVSSHFIVDNLPHHNFSQIIDREILHRIGIVKILRFLIMEVVFGRKLDVIGTSSAQK